MGMGLHAIDDLNMSVRDMNALEYLECELKEAIQEKRERK
jgi:hypothetical protein